MAPMLGPTRAEVIARLRGAADDLEITLAPNGSPIATVRRHEGSWVVQRLERNAAAAQAGYEKAIAAGDPWMPEMTWQFLEPGKVLIEADTADALADALATWKPGVFGQQLFRKEEA